MSLKDRIKNFDIEKFDWVNFSKKLITPPTLFKKRELAEGEVGYGSFSHRMFAMTVDTMLLYMVFGTPFIWISHVLFPEIDQQKLMEQFMGYSSAVLTHQISRQEAWGAMLASGMIYKMIFDYSFQTLITGGVVVLAWTKYATTPGMLLFNMYVADAVTGAKPTLKQCVLRFLGVILAVAPLTLGLIWILFDKRNQAWQDKIAHTVVLQKSSRWPWQKKVATDSK